MMSIISLSRDADTTLTFFHLVAFESVATILVQAALLSLLYANFYNA